MSEYHIPSRIETDRLVLRMFQPDDWRALHEHYSDEICTKFTFGRALTEGESWRAVSSMAGQWLLRGYGPYALVEKEAEAVIGATGLWYPCDWPEPEIKWMLIRKYWKRGFASEAARAVQSMASIHLSGTSLISLIDSKNIASAHVAAAVGAAFERELNFRGGVWHLYRHPRLAHQSIGADAPLSLTR